MLDLMLVVDDAELWHNENLMRNPHHYSFLRHLGSEVIAHVQRSGGRVYYNTLVNIDSQVKCSYALMSFHIDSYMY